MMRLFVFPYVSDLTDSYHAGGGLVVVEKDEDAAKRRIGGDRNIKIIKEEWEDVIVYELAGDPEPTMFVFPDAGCC